MLMPQAMTKEWPLLYDGSTLASWQCRTLLEREHCLGLCLTVSCTHTHARTHKWGRTTTILHCSLKWYLARQTSWDFNELSNWISRQLHTDNFTCKEMFSCTTLSLSLSLSETIYTSHSTPPTHINCGNEITKSRNAKHSMVQLQPTNASFSYHLQLCVGQSNCCVTNKSHS